MCGDMVDTLLNIIRLTNVDFSQKMMSAINVEQTITFRVRADCYVLPCQAFCDAEIAFLKAKTAMINLG